MSLSIDNGITWTDAVAQGSTLVPATGAHAGYALLGTGNGAAKSADYWFAPTSSKYFQARVRSYDSATSFVWTGLYIHYRLQGPYFEA
ncbi:MAG: hypothetical protein MZV70_54285 [Desulfobacterales bacterium]|nr:hypothetical protein [Desulfobacterales bacterium]